ncbi:PAS domain S-box protein [Leptolyngbya sp. FACHB-17]|uniref:hybrid sensor histidine kinase/response regulator n=1 Tax=unclassified Leptolyngbya TaxID=2650499 RepID=UPI001680B7B0|nr:PAS domain S-box protein [Leptolyngbya sp. FACHB-17]MBD2080749.1 PAS domain S-box protein [Leptolyngbya sp. FACHB-17]
MSSLEATSLAMGEKSIWECLSDGIAVLDQEWCLTNLNRQQTEWFGVRKEDTVGKIIWDICPEWATLEIQQQFQRSRTEQTPVQLEYFCSKWQRWFELRVCPCDTNITILTIDITQRKQKEAALRESELRFQAFMNHNPAASWIADQSGRLLYLNPTYFKLFSCPEDAVGKHISEIFPAEIAEQFLQNNQRVFETGAAIETIERAPRLDGSTGDYLVYKFPINHQIEGKLLGGVAVDISEQKRIEATLQEREQHLKIALRTAKLGSWQHDLMTHVLTCSDQCKANFGLPADAEFTHETLFAALHPEDRDRVQAAIQRSIEERTDYEVEERCFYPDGSLHWLIARGGLIYDDNGNPIRLVGVTLDITERKQFEESLRASAERLSLALTAAKMGDWSWDASTDRVTFSQQACEIFDVQPGANLTWTQLRQRLHEEDQEKARIAVEQAISERIDYDIEYRVIIADGTQRWIAAKGRAQYDTSGLLGMLGVVQDITERKRAEQEREQFLAREQATNQTLQMFIEHTPAAVAMLDRQMHYISASRCWMQEYAPDYTNLEGLSHYEVIPDIPDQWRQVHLRCLAGAAERCEEDYYPRHDNSGIWLHWEILPWYVRENEIGGIIIFAENITERKQAEQERERLLGREKIAREQAETANRLKDEFLAVLSHELRSPLNPILGWAKLLKTGNLDATRTVQAITTIERNAKLQSELIEDLLDVSRILQGKLSLSVHPIPLASTIRAAIETVQLAAEAKSITIEANLETEVGHVLGDSTRLQQVVWNLLSNAVKFTPTGGRVEVILAAANNHAEITVRDNGKGIPAHFLPYVFDYFRQGDGASTRKFGGLGLGLAIVRHLVELHGGQVKAESPGEGQGATFTVTLPLMPTFPSTSEETVPMSDTDLQGVQVLVVDDEVDNLELVQFILEEAGATVISVSRATEALERVQQSNPHLIVADIGMPEVDGYTLIQCVRELPPEQGGEIPAIALTAYAGDVNQRQALAAGFQWHLSKPVNPEALVQAIAELLHQT